MLTPLPPSRTGVAHYSSMLLPELGSRVQLRAFETLDRYDPRDYDVAIYQLGNNPHHEVMYRQAMDDPGIVVLHDLVLHHLIVELTLARGDAQSYVDSLEASHGAAGAAWARGRAAGLHSEMGNFLLPASVEVAQRSRVVIVHNRYAADRLRSFGVTTPIELVPHPYVAETRRFDRNALRARLGFSPSQRVIGFLGFVTSAKRAEVVLESFRAARRQNPDLALLIVGEASPNIDPHSLAGDGIVVTGYVPDEEFSSYYAVADRFVNLRYPTAGETSGTLIRAFDAGKPVAVSNYAQFAEFPDSCAFKVPLGGDEVEKLAEFFLADLPDPATAQRSWLESNATLRLTVDGYLAAIASAIAMQPPLEDSMRTAALPLFPNLRLLEVRAGDPIRIVVRNSGPQVLRARTYGQPEYRLIAKVFDGSDVIEDRWLELAGDLRPDETAELALPLFTRRRPLTLRLYHAIQDVPTVDDHEWARAELLDVR